MIVYFNIFFNFIPSPKNLFDHNFMRNIRKNH